jgi:phosphatidate cytidylyltransferase
MNRPAAQSAAADLTTRFAAGVVMIAVAVLATWWGGWPFRILVAAAAAIMMVEWGDIHRVARGWSYVAAAMLGLFLLGGSEWLYPVALEPAQIDAEAFAPNWLAFGLIFLLSLLAGLASRRPALIVGMVYIGLPSFAILSLSWVWFGFVFWVLLVVWATDILAYFAGRAIGGPKLAPRISPNKTWAGLAGGLAGAALAGWLAAEFFQLGPPFDYLGAPMGLLAQLGDLFESRVKRRAGVKDSGSILPGHGGVLDRLDGLLPVALAATLLMMAGVWIA